MFKSEKEALMPNLTLAIPVELKAKMDRYPEINWSEVARQAIAGKAKILEQMQALLEKSKLTDAETISIGRDIKRRASKKIRKAA